MMQSATDIKSNAKTRRLIILSGAVDGGLGLMKVVVGLLANSAALVADGIHSFSDLATDIMVWFFNRIGTQAPDEDHPYGHARFETLGTMLLGGILIGVAGMLVYDNVMRLTDLSTARIPSWPALVAAVVSISAKEWLYFITNRLGKRVRSNLLIANAWHHRSDSLSSIIVFVGVGGAMLGVIWLEMLAAIGVALMIANIGWSLTRRSVDELVDTAQSESYVLQVRENIREVEGIRGVHSIRTRKMGPDVLIDVHLQVQPYVSVSEGHHIGEWVSRRLLDSFEEINDVIVHIDAEDDEYVEPRQEQDIIPPLRSEIRQSLMDAWQSLLDPGEVRKMTLHYLNNGVDVELFLGREVQRRADANFPAELMQAAAELPWLRRVSLWYE
ncbi:MAG: cation diffusion facilitator family transporter [Gammaproteobacteria bacterium]|nr:cation diffusion facilitator family transporter [Gammaproteobacteria bacterium]